METIMQAQHRIEKEFDEPLADVVQGFVEMSYSRALIAETLEITTPSLRRFAQSRGIQFRKRPAVHREIPGRPPRMVRHRGMEKSLSEWAWDMGLSVEGVRKRIRSGRRA